MESRFLAIVKVKHRGFRGRRRSTRDSQLTRKNASIGRDTNTGSNLDNHLRGDKRCHSSLYLGIQFGLQFLSVNLNDQRIADRG